MLDATALHKQIGSLARIAEEEIRSRLENEADSNRWIGSGACLEPDFACSAQRMKRSSIEAIVPDETAFSRRDFHVLS